MPLTYAVTGVASGIGRELARILKSKGCTVIGLDLQEASEHLDQFIQADLANPRSVERAAQAIEVPLNGLCNNAGLPPRPGLERQILNVNFFGQRHLTRALLPRLGDGGAVVNVASRAGHNWKENIDQILRLAEIDSDDRLDRFVKTEQLDPTRAYDLSKEAMVVWTIAMSEQFIRRGLRVNSVSPGAVSSPLLGDFVRAFGQKAEANIQRAGRAGSPAEVANLAAFLLSEDSNWIKGTDITVDGGMSAFGQADQLVPEGSALSDI